MLKRTLSMNRPRITAEWLASIGFRWEQMSDCAKRWVLWIVCTVPRPWVGRDDLGIELDKPPWGNEENKEWFCWLRCDVAGRYHRFLHVRHLTYQDELYLLIQGLTGIPFDPQNVLCGSLRSPAEVKAIREEAEKSGISP